jgi:hypothetical protein
MTGHDLGSLGVGKVLTTREFAVTASDLTAHVEANFLGAVIGTAEEWLSTGSISGGAVSSGSPGAWGRVCPTPVAVDRVLSALGMQTTRRTVGRVRALAEILVGEPLTATAEVRYRSARNPGSTHVTLEVEVHRWQAARRVTVLGFEVGLELPAEAGPAAA